ncbi:MAG: hypothetical protein HZB24_16565 [Desulfobacterales bacterium]|nr:hypothetical protein [Desulfobacterales bacterium]
MIKKIYGCFLCITMVMAFSVILAAAEGNKITVKPAPTVMPRIQAAPPSLPRSDLATPQAAQGDLIITKVTMMQDGSGTIVAQLEIKNIGQAPVTIPAGCVIARGEVQGGSVMFPAQKVDAGLALHPGTMWAVSVPSTGWCPGGKPGAVTFRVNPDNALAESDTRNNTFALPASSFYGDISAAEVWLESQRFPPVGITGHIDPGMRNTLPRGAGADIVVQFKNAGPGFVVVCSGAALLRDVQSPLSGMYGLKTYKSPVGLIVRPGEGAAVKLQGAVGPVVLEPGSYPWPFLLNPEGTIAESSAANNTANATVRVTPPIP